MLPVSLYMESGMHRITVTKGNIVKGVYFNQNAKTGRSIAKMQHPGCKVSVEQVAQID